MTFIPEMFSATKEFISASRFLITLKVSRAAELSLKDIQSMTGEIAKTTSVSLTLIKAMATTIAKRLKESVKTLTSPAVKRSANDAKSLVRRVTSLPTG